MELMEELDLKLKTTTMDVNANVSKTSSKLSLQDTISCEDVSNNSFDCPSPEEVWYDSEDSLPASLLTSDDENESNNCRKQNFSKYYICDSQLHEKILENLGAADLLTCRLVCHNWYNIIGGTGLLWSRCSMTFTRARLQSIDAAYTKLDLVKKFHCPNFTFICIDLRDELFRNLFVIYGLGLKYLKISNCFLSKSTFDLILLQCPNIEYLDINCIPLSVSLSDVIFPPELHYNVRFPKLRTLILERLASTSKVFSNKQGANWVKEENLTGENLSAAFFQQLIESCKQLNRIKLSGWQGATIYNLLNTINCRSQLSTLKSIEFENISGKIDESHLFAFCSSNIDLRLEVLIISFKKPLPYSTTTENLDTVIEVALENHRETLQVLSLINVPITPRAFRNTFPKLKTLRLISTWIKDVGAVLPLAPKLEKIDFIPIGGNNVHSKRSKLKTAGNNTEKITILDQFWQCTVYDKICLASFISVLTTMLVLVLIFQFEAYGQWFIFFGFMLLVAICVADFYQHSSCCMYDL